MAFRGTFDYQLDDRNRVAIPPRYRDQFEAGAVLTTGLEPCIVMYTQDGFEQAAQTIEAIPEETAEGREARRDFYANAWDAQKDGQGRVLIGAKLLAHAAITKDVVVVGAGNALEIWDKETWENRDQTRATARRDATAEIGERRRARSLEEA